MPRVVQLDSGRWRVQWRDASGRQVGPVPAQSFATKTMARDFGLDREAEVRRGEVHDPLAGRVLLETWADEWLDNRVAEPRTLAKMKGHVEKYVKQPVGEGKALGALRLEQLDEMAVQSWVKRLQDLKLAPSTVTGIYTTLRSILRAAVRARKLTHDPTVGIGLPTLPPPSDFYWERPEVDAIRARLTAAVDVADDPAEGLRDLALFEVLIGTGVRWGEAAGLHLPRWVPLRRRLSVVEVLEQQKGYRLKAYPKGKHRRELPAVAPELLDAMAAHLAQTSPIPCGLDHGKGVTCPGLLFHDGKRPLSRHTWGRTVLEPLQAAAKVRRGTVHDLRHTYASWLVIDGVPLRVVQSLLGHASIRTTERYSHLAPATLDDARLLASLRGETAAERDPKRDTDVRGDLPASG